MGQSGALRIREIGRYVGQTPMAPALQRPRLRDDWAGGAPGDEFVTCDRVRHCRAWPRRPGELTMSPAVRVPAVPDGLAASGGDVHDAPRVPESPSVRFLRWALPRLGMRWPGFRRVRHLVWRRIGRRIAELHLSGPDAYREYLQAHPAEWIALDSFCRIPISRFMRDREVFERLGVEVLPRLAEEASRRGVRRLRGWSAGCASGEEPYSLALLWRKELAPRFPNVAFEVLATDVDASLIERARAARYRRSSLREVPAAWLEATFTREGEWFTVRDELRTPVEFRVSDLRQELPEGLFDVILCRNLICTYFDEPLQRLTFGRVLSVLRPGGALVIGSDERLPPGLSGLTGWVSELGIFRRVAALAPCASRQEQATPCS